MVPTCQKLQWQAAALQAAVTSGTCECDHHAEHKLWQVVRASRCAKCTEHSSMADDRHSRPQ